MSPIDFTALSDAQVVDYLLAHYDQLGAGHPIPCLIDATLDGLNSGALVIEKRASAFAIISRANRKPSESLGLPVRVDPESDLVFLFVAPMARECGVGGALLRDVQQKYMEDQAMTLICAGDSRKAFFERAGFRECGKTHEGLYTMICPAVTS